MSGAVFPIRPFRTPKSCPDDCGMCNLHVSHTVLANVDLTNRCNLSCPICFANANVQDYIYEPSFEADRPDAADASRLPSCCRSRRSVFRRRAHPAPRLVPDSDERPNEMGFSHVQCATNGLKFAEDPDSQKSPEMPDSTPSTSSSTVSIRRCTKKSAAGRTCWISR